MRVAVVGAGIVGVTTAYELAALGLEVTVFERRNSVAAEASFADAGVLSAKQSSSAGPSWVMESTTRSWGMFVFMAEVCRAMRVTII